MTAFPDLVVKMDNLTWSLVKYYWTLTGTNTGSGASVKAVRINGYEQWRFTGYGLTAESEGHFAQAAYQRQLEPWPDKDAAVKR